MRILARISEDGQSRRHRKEVRAEEAEPALVIKRMKSVYVAVEAG